MFEDETGGTLTTGFDATPPPVIGDELEYDMVDNGFGNEVKLQRKGGFGGGAKKWSPEDVAQQDAGKLTVAALQGGMALGEYKAFF